MAIHSEMQALDRLLLPLRECFDAETALRITAMQADLETQARLDLLAERHTEGLLSEEDRQEYEALVRAGLLVSVLQAQARRYLHGQQ